ncbi:MAG: hypothetical protein ACJASO_001660 [Cyclobacteriaceae bacterium]|jgi:hypothetical protein
MNDISMISLSTKRVLNFVLVLQSNGTQIKDFHFDCRQKGNRISFVVKAPTKVGY